MSVKALVAASTCKSKPQRGLVLLLSKPCLLASVNLTAMKGVGSFLASGN